MLFLIMLGVVLALTILFSFVGAEAGLGGFVIGAWLAAAVGWIANIITVFKGPALALWGAAEIVRVIGIFVVPVGSVLGYF